MTDYTSIVDKVSKAVEKIKDERLKEIAFARLLDDALGKPLQTQSAGSAVSTPNFVQNKVRKNRSKSGGKLSNKPYNPDSVRSEVKGIFNSVEANEEGLVPFGNIKKKMNKYFWVLEVARIKGIDSLTNNEIAYALGNTFREGVTEKQVTNIASQLKKGFVQKSEFNGVQAWRILAEGSKIVKEKNENGTSSKASDKE